MDLTTHTKTLTGLHIVADIECHRGCKDGVAFMQQLTQVILQLGLQEVGRCYHSFDGGGFTAVI